jgi:hypothetical protein
MLSKDRGARTWGAVLVIVCVISSCVRAPLVTNGVAERRFTYRGKPVHPLCLDFSAEGSSRREPMALATCTDTSVDSRLDRRGWRETYRPPHSGKGNVSYRVLAARGNRFLVATEVNGFGSGEFSYLFWAKLGDRNIVINDDLLAGDRCDGSISNYVIEGSDIRFDVSTTPRGIAALAGLRRGDSAFDGLRDDYYACEGGASYRYNIASEKMQFVSLTLDPEMRPDTTSGLQACFDRFAEEYIAESRKTFSPDDLKEFGGAFEIRCVRPK